MDRPLDPAARREEGTTSYPIDARKRDRECGSEGGARAQRGGEIRAHRRRLRPHTRLGAVVPSEFGTRRDARLQARLLGSPTLERGEHAPRHQCELLQICHEHGGVRLRAAIVRRGFDAFQRTIDLFDEVLDEPITGLDAAHHRRVEGPESVERRTSERDRVAGLSMYGRTRHGTVVCRSVRDTALRYLLSRLC